MKRILLCTDGSKYARVSCEYASWLAGLTQAKIDALYLTDIRQFEVPLVADLSGSLGIQPYQDVITQLQEMEKQKAGIIEEATLKAFKEKGQESLVQFHHRTGLLVDSLDQFEDNVDLVVLGKRGENADFAHEHLGSTMERVIRASAKPCLVTSRSFHVIRKIIIAYDGGASCRKAVRFLAGFEGFKDQELHIVSVIEHDDKDTTEKWLKEAELEMREGGFDPVCKVLSGEPEEAISRYVESEKMDMLVMGAYGHSRIRYLLIGSTTTSMIRSCKVPVLCFR